MKVGEFAQNAGAKMRTAWDEGRPLHVTDRDREYMTIAPTSEHRQGEQALSVVRGLLKIVRDDQGAPEDCDKYRAFGQMLAELIDAGHLSIEEDTAGRDDRVTSS